MSAKVKLSGALPGDEYNGLDDIAGQLIETPEKLQLCLVWLDVRKIEDITDTAERIPVVRIRRTEPVGDAKNAPQELRDLALRLYEKRTGKTPLPIDQITRETDGPVD